MELQTPNTVPVIEKSISPLEPIMKPKTTMHRVTMTGKEVVVCKRTKLGANKGKKEKKIRENNVEKNSQRTSNKIE